MDNGYVQTWISKIIFRVINIQFEFEFLCFYPATVCILNSDDRVIFRILILRVQSVNRIFSLWVLTLADSNKMSKIAGATEVSKCRKQFLVFSILPKNERNSLSWAYLLKKRWSGYYQDSEFCSFLEELRTH